MKANTKYLFKGLAWGVGVLVAVYLALILYVTLNKNQIINRVSREMSEKVRGKVTIGGSELSFFRGFPNMSVLLKDVKVSDSMYPLHKKYFFTAKEVFLRLSIPRLVRKESPVKGIQIREAAINVFTHLDGYTNRYLLQPKDGGKEARPGKKPFYLDKILLDEVGIIFTDSIKGKFHNIHARSLVLNIDDKDDFLEGDCDMNLLVRGIVFNPFKGGYLQNQKVKGKFPFRFNRESGRLLFENIALRIDEQLFRLTSSFDLSGENRSFSIKVGTQKAGYEKIKAIFPEKIRKSLSLVKLDGPLDVSAEIGGDLKGGDPLVNVKFSTPKTSMLTPFMDFSNASFSGIFTNEVVKGVPRKDPNSRITISAFAGEWRGLPVSAKMIDLVDLKNPKLDCDISSNFSLSRLNEVMESEALLFKEGEASVHLKYTGPMERNSQTPTFMSGNVNITKGKLTYSPRNVDLNKVQAALHFDKSDLFLDKLSAEVFGKQVNMTAEARQLLTLLNTQPNAALIKWNINIPDLDLLPYTMLLQKKQKRQGRQGKKMMNAAAKIDQVLDEGKLDVQLRVGKLQYKKFVARNFSGNVSLLQDRYIIHDAHFNHANGTLQLKGSLVQNGNGTHRADINTSLKGVDVNQVFAAFQNFGQDGLTSEHIAGNLDASINASLTLQESGKVIPSSAAGTVKFSLKNGELIDFEPVKKIQEFIFKNRDFENIRFAELKNTLELKGSDIQINPMEIQSSVLTMFVQGIYSGSGRTDMQIRLPLSNLKKRGKDFNPENLGTNRKVGASIYLRGRPGEDGNIKFKLDLFNKFNKEKKMK